MRHAVCMIGLTVTLVPGVLPAQTFMGLGRIPPPPDLASQFGAIRSNVVAISADGTTVLSDRFFENGTRFYVARWTAEGGWATPEIVLDDSFASWSGSAALSADGSVVIGTVRYPDFSGSGFDSHTVARWSAAEGLLELECGSPEGVSADGSVVVGRQNGRFCGGHGPWRWTADTGAVPISDAKTAKVSADGSVVVQG